MPRPARLLRLSSNRPGVSIGSYVVSLRQQFNEGFQPQYLASSISTQSVSMSMSLLPNDNQAYSLASPRLFQMLRGNCRSNEVGTVDAKRQR
ncbi:hypothetical protein WAI453_008561 [Rhynchosporium graminicola]